MIRVSNIERFATHDGPGIRTVVFFKGCPLHCPWCANPETWHTKREVLHDERKCTLCGRCATVCPKQAITVTENSWHLDRIMCDGCGQCQKACLNDALEVNGQDMDEDEILDIIAKDDDYYKASGGGVTLSGGEVFFQDPLPLLKKLKEKGYHVAVETEGAYESRKLLEAIDYVDLFLFDLKCADRSKLKKYTGADLNQILANIHLVPKDKLILRTPVIPGFNDEGLKDIISLAAKLQARQLHLLAYHSFGKAKWHRLNRPYKYEDLPPMDASLLDPYKSYGESLGVKIVIGG